MRLTLMDGLLAILRSLRDNSLGAAISHGEACLVHMCVFSPEARLAAYTERSVTESERATLEEVAESQEFAVFIAPMVMPKASFAQIRDFMPEINVVNVSRTQAVVILPARDANSEQGRTIS